MAAVTIIALTGDNSILDDAQLAKVSNSYYGIEDQIKLSYMAIVSEVQVKSALNAHYSANTEENAEEILKILQKNLQGNSSTEYEFAKKTSKATEEDGTEKTVVNEIWVKSIEGQIQAGKIESGVPRYNKIIYSKYELNGQKVSYEFDVAEPVDVAFASAPVTPEEKEDSESPADPDTPDLPEEPDITEKWNFDKVYAYESKDGVIVPVPIGFSVSEEETEQSVATGLVIKIEQDGITSEFVWVPVDNPSEMFGIDKDGNALGKLYEFSTSGATPLNWTETENAEGKKVMSWTSSTGYREPDVVTYYDGSDATSDSSYFKAAISQTMTGSAFKTQLQNEFNAMKRSVETYHGFYIGRYETGNLSQTKAAVVKNNTDIAKQNWYVQYQKSKTIAQGTNATSSMIWGCQWDATMKWFLSSTDEKVKTYVTNSSGRGNYSGTNENKAIATGSNDDYSVNNIYDMAGNIHEWTLEGQSYRLRIFRGWRLQQ